MSPTSSTPTQSDSEGHERLTIGWPSSTCVAVQAPGPPVGFFEAMTSPPTATRQSDVEAQETARAWAPTPLTFLQAFAPPVGSLEVKMPLSPTTTHSEPAGAGQDTPVSSLGAVYSGSGRSLTLALDHALTPPVGSVEVKTLPYGSTPAHSEADAHDRLVTSRLLIADGNDQYSDGWASTACGDSAQAIAKPQRMASERQGVASRFPMNRLILQVALYVCCRLCAIAAESDPGDRGARVAQASRSVRALLLK
jgi:hypothetical protein